MTRLQAICDIVSTRIILDVGSDHGFVPKLLLEGGRIDHAFVSEISEKCLSKARKNLSSFKDCTFLLGDGLKVAENIDKSILNDTTAIITGMGGEEIIKILSKEISPLPFYILGPHTSNFRLKDYLYEQNFSILKDKIVKDGEKFYNLLLVSHASNKMNTDKLQLYFGKDNVKDMEEDFICYCLFLQDKYEKILKFRQDKELKEKYEMLNKILGERKC